MSDLTIKPTYLCVVGKSAVTPQLEIGVDVASSEAIYQNEYMFVDLHKLLDCLENEGLCMRLDKDDE